MRTAACCGEAARLRRRRSDPFAHALSGELDPALRLVAAPVEPGGRLMRAWPLTGGIASAVTALEIERADGTRTRLVVRARNTRPGSDCGSVAHEYRLLVRLPALGLPAPRPRRLDESCTVLPEPYAVFDYLDGSPRFSADDPEATALAFAAQLWAIHRIDGTRPELAGLPEQVDTVAKMLARGRHEIDDSLREGLIREVLGRHWPPSPPARLSLLHGDFWPGNVLWADEEIVAVLDWEEAAVGDPLADVAITRLDLLWAFGPVAMAAFTDAYRELRSPEPIDPTVLALWDLVAAGRPAGALSSWAAPWAGLGRPDVTRATMQAAQHWFVDRALAVLGGR